LGIERVQAASSLKTIPAGTKVFLTLPDGAGADVAALAPANLVAAFPGRYAARRPTALVLRAE